MQLEDLLGQQLLLLAEGHCLRGQALDVCFSAGATENNSFRATSLETLRHMVAEGVGMTLLPELSVPSKKLASEPVCYIPFAEPRPSRRVGMIYRKGSYREQTYQNIAQVIREKLK